ncbi:low molecular weight phosphatase family protein [Fulvivirga sediminis]|uniref:Protein-tyrosine-phosphatase n=1 Tax=Fulvivirga sediminis TaxID=2803949 RepID=A0A937FBX1_9BACT|nr:protein-tyrosine-phosphatase [Fulvivirga sediminis]MBL3657633.1 protein-tyrosine-phosphatase [Fulvivirga sediminis]
MNKDLIYADLRATVEDILKLSIAAPRLKVLREVSDYIQKKIDEKEKVQLNFICTHNSRRSQFSQIWAQTAAFYYNLPISCFSGGIEVTAFNPRAVKAIEKAGFKINSGHGNNPFYEVSYSSESQPIIAYSKLYNTPEEGKSNFAAILTCSHAEENCPFIPLADQRISLKYTDPKAFDDTSEEEKEYIETSTKIASEIFFIFSQINQ